MNITYMKDEELSLISGAVVDVSKTGLMIDILIDNENVSGFIIVKQGSGLLMGPHIYPANHGGW